MENLETMCFYTCYFSVSCMLQIYRMHVIFTEKYQDSIYGYFCRETWITTEIKDLGLIYRKWHRKVQAKVLHQFFFQSFQNMHTTTKWLCPADHNSHFLYTTLCQWWGQFFPWVYIHALKIVYISVIHHGRTMKHTSYPLLKTCRN